MQRTGYPWTPVADREESGGPIDGSLRSTFRHWNRMATNVLSDFRKTDCYGTTVYGCYIDLAFGLGAVRAFTLVVAMALRGILVRVLGWACHSPLSKRKARSGTQHRRRAG